MDVSDTLCDCGKLQDMEHLLLYILCLSAYMLDDLWRAKKNAVLR